MTRRRASELDALPRPVELDLGCGSGALLVELANLHPGSTFWGVEFDGASAARARHRVREHSLTNVSIVEAEAQEYLEGLKPGSVDVIHLYQPSPHPPTIGLCNRLMSEDFRDLLHRVLRPLGRLRIATDQFDYFHRAMRKFRPELWLATDWHMDFPALLRGATVGSPIEMEYRQAGVQEILSAELVALRPFASSDGFFPGVG